jgi:ABC-type nitrate/sulfonate/bicarbonate transport system substrate-binding protein
MKRSERLFPTAMRTTILFCQQQLFPLHRLTKFVFKLCVAVAILNSAVSAQEKKLDAVNVSFSSVSPPRLHLWMARDLGIFEKHGLDVKLIHIAGGPTSLQALLGGNLSIVTAGGQATVAAAARGAPIVIFGNSHYTPYILSAGPSIPTVEALRGKVIGSSRPGAAADFITRLVLTKLGLDPNQQVTIRYTGLSTSRERLILMTQGTIDATLVTPEDHLELQIKGYKFNILADSVELGAIATEDFTATRDFIKNRPYAAAAFLKAIGEAVALARRDRSLAQKFFRRYMKLEESRVLESMYKTYVFTAYPEKPYPRIDAIQAYVDNLAPTMAELKGRKGSEFVTMDIAAAIEREGFWGKNKP